MVFNLEKCRQRREDTDVLFNYEASDIKHPMIICGPSHINSYTKSLVLVIDKQLTYRKHAEATAEEANTRKWNTISCLWNTRWSLIIPTLTLLYHSTLLILNVSSIWYDKKCCTPFLNRWIDEVKKISELFLVNVFTLVDYL